jgi:hypothetical protein
MDIPTQYELDSKNVITAVNPAWEAFALANAGRQLLAEQVVGRRLFDYITGDPTRMYLEALLQTVRRAAAPLVRPYRCDSPGLRRFMEMEIRPLAGGGLELSHRLLRTQLIERPVSFTTTAAAGGQLLKRCSVCGRLAQPGGWREPSDVAAAGGELPVIYTVCPDCKTQAPRRLRRPAAAH